MDNWFVSTFFVIHIMLLMDMYAQVILSEHVFRSPGYILRSGIAVSYSNSV